MQASEPSQEFRRLHALRDWSHENLDKTPRSYGNGRCGWYWEHQGGHDSQWASIVSVSAKIGRFEHAEPLHSLTARSHLLDEVP